MSKFSVGDRVVVVKTLHGEKQYIGNRGAISRIDEAALEYEVGVEIAPHMIRNFDSDELEFEHVYDSLSSPASNLVSSDDAVNPSHYKSHPSGVECKDIIGHYPFFIGSAMKYLWRAGLKTEDPIEDLRKAMKNIEFEIERRMAARSGD